GGGSGGGAGWGWVGRGRAAYAADLSTLLGSLPLKAPPPWRATPPYVSTMILRPVSPASAAGPPSTNDPLGLTMILVAASTTWPFKTGLMTSSRTPSAISFCVALAACWVET